MGGQVCTMGFEPEEDRLEHELGRHLNDPVAQGGDGGITLHLLQP